MIEYEDELTQCLKHKVPILMINCDKQIKRNQRLLCSECMKNLESTVQLMSFQKVFDDIRETQKQKIEVVENEITISIKHIENIKKRLLVIIIQYNSIIRLINRKCR
ncbi:unnamed protein product [Paramecium pentaurelia]|uniref:Uncharacterized protein n=1 Tax=Paramecium pentaurelia TaxID=43138 RepID=A0A8S1XBP6_9CILI|nr:unnamed protein product [Paramecium pentaurelia]